MNSGFYTGVIEKLQDGGRIVFGYKHSPSVQGVLVADFSTNIFQYIKLTSDYGNFNAQDFSVQKPHLIFSFARVSISGGLTKPSLVIINATSSQIQYGFYSTNSILLNSTILRSTQSSTSNNFSTFICRDIYNSGSKNVQIVSYQYQNPVTNGVQSASLSRDNIIQSSGLINHYCKDLQVFNLTLQFVLLNYKSSSSPSAEQYDSILYLNTLDLANNQQQYFKILDPTTPFLAFNISSIFVRSVNELYIIGWTYQKQTSRQSGIILANPQSSQNCFNLTKSFITIQTSKETGVQAISSILNIQVLTSINTYYYIDLNFQKSDVNLHTDNTETEYCQSSSSTQNQFQFQRSIPVGFQTSYNYKVGQHPLVIQAPYYTIQDNNCEDFSPIYSAKLQNGQALPNFMTYNETSAQLSIQSTLAQDTGTYLITFNQSQILGPSFYDDITITVKANIYPPRFIVPLQPLKLFVNQSMTYVLPSIEDQDNDSWYLTFGELPSFITFNNSTRVFSIGPYFQYGNYSISIMLNDSELFQTYNLTIEVQQNNMAPQFTELLHDQNLFVNQVRIYTLPSVYDQENNTIYFQLLNQNLPKFIKFDSILRQFTIQPTTDEDAIEITIQVLLSDYLLTNRQEFKIMVKKNTQAPYFIQPLVDQVIYLNQNITYKLSEINDSDGNEYFLLCVTLLPSFIAFDNSTRIFNIHPTSSQQHGNYTVTLSLSDFEKSQNYSFVISVQTNIYSPLFSSPLQNITVCVNCSSYQYALPQAFDQDNDDILISVDNSYNPFLSYDQSSKQIIIHPTQDNQVGHYSLQINLTDNIHISQFQLIIQIKINLEPPKFISKLEDFIVLIGRNITYQLPQIVDIDNDSYQVEVGNLPVFAKFNNLTNTFSFSPQIQSQKGNYTLMITLKDYYRQRNYNLIIEVKESLGGPQFLSSLQNQTVFIGQSLNYTLPEYYDPDNDQAYLEIELNLPDYIYFDQETKTFIFTPTSANFIGELQIEISIKDNQYINQFKLFITVKENLQAPNFISPLQNLTVQLNQHIIYELPEITDLDGNQFQLQVVSELPSFIVYKNQSNNHTFDILPQSSRDHGTYEIVIKLSDFSKSQTYSFFIIAKTNFNAPEFESGLLNIFVCTQCQRQLALPNIIDQDRINEVQVNILGFLPEFVKFDSDRKIFLIQPNDTASVGSYEIQVQLSDGHLSTNYSFQIIVRVNQYTPYFVDELQQQFLFVTQTLTYQLPDINDEDGNDFYLEILEDLPSFVEYDSQNRIFKINPISDEDTGTYFILIRVSDFERSRNYTLKIIVDDNLHAPKFEFDLPELLVCVGCQKIYELPGIVDQDSEDLITVRVYESLPQFVIYNVEERVFVIKPYDSENVGEYQIYILISDGFHDVQDVLKIKVLMNLDGPHFEPTLEDQIVYVSQRLSYILPKVIDEDGDNYQIEIIDEHKLPSFISFDLESREFSFEPKSINDKGEHPISINLKDYYLTQSFSFKVIVRFDSAPPEFNQKLQDQTLTQGQYISYHLPNYSDIDGDEIQLEVLTLLPSYIIFDSIHQIFTIKYNQMQLDIQNQTIEIMLKDILLSQKYTFNIYFLPSNEIINETSVQGDQFQQWIYLDRAQQSAITSSQLLKELQQDKIQGYISPLDSNLKVITLDYTQSLQKVLFIANYGGDFVPSDIEVQIVKNKRSRFQNSKIIDYNRYKNLFSIKPESKYDIGFYEIKILIKNQNRVDNRANLVAYKFQVNVTDLPQTIPSIQTDKNREQRIKLIQNDHNSMPFRAQISEITSRGIVQIRFSQRLKKINMSNEELKEQRVIDLSFDDPELQASDSYFWWIKKVTQRSIKIKIAFKDSSKVGLLSVLNLYPYQQYQLQKGSIKVAILRKDIFKPINSTQTQVETTYLKANFVPQLDDNGDQANYLLIIGEIFKYLLITTIIFNLLTYICRQFYSSLMYYQWWFLNNAISNGQFALSDSDYSALQLQIACSI
ncbi:ig family protein [Stylonychia lemnae]|uniref:Ig family protein n=1 Tax=Stylonychia lemnae TaxID=5949 RepID=A0A078AWZ7_STYLE|nr:ig family protein [Stylonychia lemnae]|eukprot:CDW85318.1 ig family protein [Stylonychia lemnae]